MPVGRRAKTRQTATSKCLELRGVASGEIVRAIIGWTEAVAFEEANFCCRASIFIL